MKFKLLFIWLLLFAACTSRNSMIAIGQVNIPDTPSGKIFKSWLESYNSGDTALIGAFTRAFYPELMLKDKQFDAEEWIGYYKKFGSLKVYSYDTTYVDDRGNSWPVNALLTNQSQEKWMRLKLIVEPKSQKIYGISFKTASRPKVIKIKRVSDKDLAKQLDEKITHMVDKDEFSGVVLIARNSKPFYEKAFGMANRENNIVNNIKTKFNLASLSKMFTSIAIAQLVEAGKISFSDTLIKVLPEYPNKEVASRITIHQLLTHTSGLGDVFTQEFFDLQDKGELKNTLDWYKTFVHYPLAFEPGSQFKYSNAGYIVLGAIIEKLSGQDYYSYIKEHITKPLGINSTEFYSTDDNKLDIAKPYTFYPEGMEQVDKIQEFKNLAYRGSAAGGGYSTAEDLLKFMVALREYKLLNKELTEMLVTTKVKSADGMPDWAYGCFDSNAYGIRTVGHGGTIPGVSTMAEIYWDYDCYVIILANIDPPAADDVANFIKDRIKIN